MAQKGDMEMKTTSGWEICDHKPRSTRRVWPAEWLNIETLLIIFQTKWDGTFYTAIITLLFIYLSPSHIEKLDIIDFVTVPIIVKRSALSTLTFDFLSRLRDVASGWKRFLSLIVEGHKLSLNLFIPAVDVWVNCLCIWRYFILMTLSCQLRTATKEIRKEWTQKIEWTM